MTAGSGPREFSSTLLDASRVADRFVQSLAGPPSMWVSLVLCAARTDSLFWDGLHQTAAAHASIAGRVLALLQP